MKVMKDHEVVILCHEWPVHGMAENEASQLLVGGTDVVERNGRIGDLGVRRSERGGYAPGWILTSASLDVIGDDRSSDGSSLEAVGFDASSPPQGSHTEDRGPSH